MYSWNSIYEISSFSGFFFNIESSLWLLDYQYWLYLGNFTPVASAPDEPSTPNDAVVDPRTKPQEAPREGFLRKLMNKAQRKKAQQIQDPKQRDNDANDEASYKERAESGVPQGTLFSSLFFSIVVFIARGETDQYSHCFTAVFILLLTEMRAKLKFRSSLFVPGIEQICCHFRCHLKTKIIHWLRSSNKDDSNVVC